MTDKPLVKKKTKLSIGKDVSQEVFDSFNERMREEFLDLVKKGERAHAAIKSLGYDGMDVVHRYSERHPDWNHRFNELIVNPNLELRRTKYYKNNLIEDKHRLVEALNNVGFREKIAEMAAEADTTTASGRKTLMGILKYYVSLMPKESSNDINVVHKELYEGVSPEDLVKKFQEIATGPLAKQLQEIQDAETVDYSIVNENILIDAKERIKSKPKKKKERNDPLSS